MITMQLAWCIDDSLLDHLFLCGDEEQALERLREIAPANAPDYDVSRLTIQSVDMSSRANCSDEIMFTASFNSVDDAVNLLKQFAALDTLEKNDLYFYFPSFSDEQVDELWSRVNQE